MRITVGVAQCITILWKLRLRTEHAFVPARNLDVIRHHYAMKRADFPRQAHELRFRWW